MNDFDFFEGEWISANRKLRKRLAGSDDWDEFEGTSRSWRIFDGGVSVDEITFPTTGTRGLTVRLYDPATELWSIYWISSLDPKMDTKPLVGSFEGNRGVFYADDEHEGTPVRCRFIWTVHGPDACRWEQAFSVDGEQTWETNWTMEFTRA
ncbi:hypothetical protein [Nonomuraea sediminis]|uniref:hypothetical protein n=1 Tax=Nonomuraea sediminis TaxID=2835864 RepID=UPI001BDC2F93|nr:hypothetical protein [Nonomuraea sediminis]